VIAGERAAYALCRPPGHHAYADRANGFCYLNNVAIAAQHLRSVHPRVAILDIDVHHGNGTQGIFYRRADVLTISLHGDPRNFTPFFTGHAHERGEVRALGYNINKPLALGTDLAGYLPALHDACASIRAYAPGALVVALGLDAHERDPYKGMRITTPDFATLMARSRAWTCRPCWYRKAATCRRPWPQPGECASRVRERPMTTVMTAPAAFDAEVLSEGSRHSTSLGARARARPLRLSGELVALTRARPQLPAALGRRWRALHAEGLASAESALVADFQTQALLHIAATDPGLPCSASCPHRAANHRSSATPPTGLPRVVALFSYLSGLPMRTHHARRGSASISRARWRGLTSRCATSPIPPVRSNCRGTSSAPDAVGACSRTSATRHAARSPKAHGPLRAPRQADVAAPARASHPQRLQHLQRAGRPGRHRPHRRRARLRRHGARAAIDDLAVAASYQLGIEATRSRHRALRRRLPRGAALAARRDRPACTR
jgi:hypothetical protein